jgi:glycosyltransferase 2 family protein
LIGFGGSGRRGIRLFAAPSSQPRARRGTDLLLLAVSLALLAPAIVAYPPGSFERSLQRFVASLPDWIDPASGFFADLAWFWACVLVLLALVRKRFFVVGQAIAALLLAGLAGVVSVRLATGSWPDLTATLFGTVNAPRFPGVRLAEAGAVMLTITPHLVRPVRVLDRWILGLAAVGTLLDASATPFGTIAALLLGVLAAASVRLVTGTSIGRPTIPDVSVGLSQLGVSASQLEVAEHQVAGVFHVTGVDEDGKSLLVKVYGRDAYDTQFMARLWRSLWYRGLGSRVRMSRIESAEHEAFISLLVAGGGVPTRELVTAGATVDDDALVVLRGDVTALTELALEELNDDLVRGAWLALTRLEGLKVAHGLIDPTAVVLAGGRVGLVDFGDGVVAPGPHAVATDRAALLMTTAALVGIERARAAGVESLGRPEIEALLPYLQSAALGAGLRRALKTAKIDVDEFREQTAAALGVEAPELVALRRVSWRTLAQIALLALATYAILSAATNVDWSEFISSLGEASVAWIVAAFIVAQLPRLTQSLSTLGSVPTSLPFGPVYAMQLATGYMNVALPSNLARMAVNIRFFQRQGLTAPTAVAAGTIDSFASTVIQGVLLVILLIFSESSLAFDLPFPSGGARTLLWIVLGLVLVSMIVVVAVRRVRRAISDNVTRWWPDVRSALANLRSPNKLALVLLGSLATELLFAIALGLFARSFGYEISIAELLVINIGVSLLGSLVPIPGNIGVAEFGLSIGLVSAGMTDEAALAAVLVYRISTFYLPPVWGFFALLWLQRNRYL